MASAALSSFLMNWSERLRRSEEHTSELQSLAYLVCRLLLEKKKTAELTRNEPIAVNAGPDARGRRSQARALPPAALALPTDPVVHAGEPPSPPYVRLISALR